MTEEIIPERPHTGEVSQHRVGDQSAERIETLEGSVHGSKRCKFSRNIFIFPGSEKQSKAKA